MQKQRLPFFTWFSLAIRYAARIGLYALFVLASTAGVVAIPILMFRLDWPAAFEFIVWGSGFPIFIAITYFSVEQLKEKWVAFEEYRAHIANDSQRQNLLIRFLRSDPSAEVRRSAARNCTDREQLLQTALFDPDRLSRSAAVRQIQEEALLYAILAGSTDREEVLKSMQNRLFSKKGQRFLADIALEGETLRVRILAAEAVKEFELALLLLRQSNDSAVRLVALKQMKTSERRLEQQPYFLLLAREDANPEVRRAAAYLLSDLPYVRALIRLSSDDSVRAIAAMQMSSFSLSGADQALLLNVALGTKEAKLQQAAVRGIHNGVMLQTVLERLVDSNVRKIALECIKRELLVLEHSEVFLAIALEDSCDFVRMMAADLVTEPSLVSRLLRESGDEKVREQTLRRTEDQDALVWSARNDTQLRLRFLAMNRIPSFEERLSITCEDSNPCFFESNIPWLIAKAVQGGGIPIDMEERIRRAVCAEGLLKKTVCPKCGGEVTFETEWEMCEEQYAGASYPEVVQKDVGYRCLNCGCLSQEDPTIPFDQLLQNHRKEA